MDQPDIRRKRGRPPKADKLSDAERARRYRARRRMQPKDSWNYQQLTELTRKDIARMLADAASRPEAASYLVKQWAYGMFLLWDRVTAQCQLPEDRKALLDMLT